MYVEIFYDDETEIDNIVSGLQADLDVADIPWKTYNIRNKDQLTKGSDISSTSFLISLLSAGGAATVAVGARGFLTTLAGIFGDYLNKGVKIRIKSKNGKTIELSGTKNDVLEVLEHIKRSENE